LASRDPARPCCSRSWCFEEIIYVLEGTLEHRLKGKQPVTLKAGDVLFIPARTIHAAKNVGSGNASELATYIVEKGKPPLTLVN
jgi:quercetin dioxygenase-like cupin family protein